MQRRRRSLRTGLVRGLGAVTATVALASGLTACGGDARATGAGGDVVTVGAVSNGAARQTELTVPAVEALRAQLPAAVRERGELVIGVGALPAGYPPLAYVGIDSGKVDVAFTNVTVTEERKKKYEFAGTHSGAGESLQGLIAATARKNSGLAKPVAAAINHLIDNGQYRKLLAAWNLSDEAVTTSEVNPLGLPLTNS
ncbi:transporter substrate-binding domain-containing protein [Streptomyces sp. NPDC048337]|uniref:transporter substrate-binding domain-containing protein n=1 Tax=Streptomyces sp. NPDC048337 TaxID=3365535 RepID=UPI0037236A32